MNGISSIQVGRPEKIRVAAIIWIIFGALLLVGLSIWVAFWMVIGIEGPTFFWGRFILISLIAIVGIVGILVGFRCIRGNARDTLAYGIVSIILGSPTALMGIFMVTVSFFEYDWMLPFLVGGVFCLLVGGTLLFAGVFAIQARARYKSWRDSQMESRRPLHR